MGRKRPVAAGSRRCLAHRSSGCGSGVLGFRGGDLARKREKQNEGVLLVLLRAKGGEPGHCPRLATAAARWPPSGARVCVAETGKLQREGKRAARSLGTTRGCHREQEVAGADPERRAALHRWTEEAGREGGGRRSWTSL